MRLPIILILLTLVLLPADLRGLAAQLESGAYAARSAVVKFLDRDDGVQVAEASPTVVGGRTIR